MNMNQKNLDALLNLASKKFGTTPDELKKNLQNGDIGQVIQGMSKEDSQKLQEALNNKKLTEKILGSPEAQELMKKLSDKK